MRSGGTLCAVDVHVDCYAGHRGEETPRRFELGGRRVEVLEVVDRWYGPDHRYFKVRLRHDEPADRWETVVLTREP